MKVTFPIGIDPDVEVKKIFEASPQISHVHFCVGQIHCTVSRLKGTGLFPFYLSGAGVSNNEA